MHPILEKLRAGSVALWRDVADGLTALDVTDDPSSEDYFWLHTIFANLLKIDPSISEIWSRCTLIKADAPHYLQQIGLLNPATPEVLFHIRNRLTNVYKLSRRIDPSASLKGTVLEALFTTLESRLMLPDGKRPLETTGSMFGETALACNDQP